jgi:hypothetical protein
MRPQRFAPRLYRDVRRERAARHRSQAVQPVRRKLPEGPGRECLK